MHVLWKARNESYVGAGNKTPKPDVQNDHIFTGKHGESTDKTTWDEKDHTYKSVTTPVVPGYYADKKTAGGKTFTPDNLTATDQVTYKKFGKIVPVDPQQTPIPEAPKPVFNNDPRDSTRAGETPVPAVLGYKPTSSEPVLPTHAGEDQPVVYVKTEDKTQKVSRPSQMLVHYKGAGTKTPADNRQVYLFNGQKFADVSEWPASA